MITIEVTCINERANARGIPTRDSRLFHTDQPMVMQLKRNKPTIEIM